MYLVKAEDFQRPSNWNVESGMPVLAAVVTAPIRKLWPLILAMSQSELARACQMRLTKN